MNVSRSEVAILSLALISLAASELMAQGRGGGRPGGFGGRAGDPAIGLLQIEEVRQELEMFPDQEAAVVKMQEQARESRGGEEGFDFGRIRDASEEERRKIFEELAERRRKAAQRAREQLETILAPDQLERLDEIRIQIQGVQALDSDEVVGALKITEAQTKEIEKVREQGAEKFRAAMRDTSRENMREAMMKVRGGIEKSIMAVLTSEQRSNFEAMKGQPFEMPERRGFAGRGGRGGEAGGGEARRGQARRGGPGGRGGFRGPGGGEDGGRRRGGGRPQRDD